MALTNFGKLIPGTIDIPSDLGTFKTKQQVVWTGSEWRTKGSFYPDFGFTGFFKQDPSYSIHYQRDMYSADVSSGLAIKGDAGNEHKGNYDLHGNGRWMPASVFNGIGFEVNQANDHKHAIYLRYYALAFASRTSSAWRIYGVDTGARNPSKEFRYIRIASNSGAVNTIRNWGPDWLFQGVILHVWNNGGTGSGQSWMYVYNMRVGSKMSTLGGQYRMLPAGKRSYSNRNARVGTVGFTDPFS